MFYNKLLKIEEKREENLYDLVIVQILGKERKRGEDKSLEWGERFWGLDDKFICEMLFEVSVG